MYGWARIRVYVRVCVSCVGCARVITRKDPEKESG